jgi:N-acetylglucosaminyldiphosphoundecaprenol N-acetyl-beta-D-mannosaminyltransferase
MTNPVTTAIRAARISILGSPVDSLTMAEALAWVEAVVAARSAPALVIAMNAYKYRQVSRDPRLRQIVTAADLVIPEYATVWASRVLGTPVKAHIGGIMLFMALLDDAGSRGYRMFFLGARPPVIEAMVSRLKRERPALQIAGWHHGYFRGREDQIVDTVRQSRADILFAALGTPYQEYWLSDNLQHLAVPVALGVGGSFDVVAGAKRDAPTWARGHGLEWLYRLWQEPRAYWKRYLVANPWFVYQVLRARVRGKPGAPRGPLSAP